MGEDDAEAEEEGGDEDGDVEEEAVEEGGVLEDILIEEELFEAIDDGGGGDDDDGGGDDDNDGGDDGDCGIDDDRGKTSWKTTKTTKTTTRSFFTSSSPCNGKEQLMESMYFPFTSSGDNFEDDGDVDDGDDFGDDGDVKENEEERKESVEEPPLDEFETDEYQNYDDY